MKLDVSQEVRLQTSRSGGKGGQHVNKVETQVELRFSILHSQILTAMQKEWLQQKLKKYLTKRGEILVRCAATRSQAENRVLALARLHHLLETALQKRKPRIATGVPVSTKQHRLQNKKLHGLRKQERRAIDTRRHDDD